MKPFNYLSNAVRAPEIVAILVRWGFEDLLLQLDTPQFLLRNLVRNAVEAGAVKLKFKVETSDTKVRITLADDGPGMNDTEAEKAFDPFFTTKARGTGLGLAISRQEIEEIGGSLEYDSPPETGAKFTIDIPINS